MNLLLFVIIKNKEINKIETKKLKIKENIKVKFQKFDFRNYLK